MSSRRGSEMEMKTFTEFWKGMFFLVSTVSVSAMLYLVVAIWQPLWTEGFSNFGDISKAIGRLEETTRPMAEIAPLMLGEMDEMRETMGNMQRSLETIEEVNPSLKAVTYSMNRMTWVMERRMGDMSHEIDQMEDKFSPSGMMPFNW